MNNKIGKTNISNEGYEMKIVGYKNNKYIIEFQDEYRTNVSVQYSQFKSGKVKNPYHKSICGIGYYGVGKYKSRENGKQTYAYKEWQDMIIRCYDPYHLNKFPTYIDCYVCDEWLNFQNFAKWFYKHQYECNEKLCLDKDILIKGNKIYSPETCVLVPSRINTLLIKCNASRGGCPIGVYWDKNANKFKAQCRILSKDNKKKRKHLGLYNTLEEAFLAYKNFKESYIKQVADEYYFKNGIPKIIYNALYNWKIEIDD